MDEDEEFEFVPDYEVGAHRASWWVVACAVFELIEGAFQAVATFFSALSLMSAAHYKHQEQQTTFHSQAALELETLTKES